MSSGMITGKAAAAMYWGGIIILGLVVAAITILAMSGAETPPELTMIITTIIGFLFGAHVMPPGVRKVGGDELAVADADLEETEKVIIQEKTVTAASAKDN